MFFQIKFSFNVATELLAIEYYAGINNGDYSELSVIGLKYYLFGVAGTVYGDRSEWMFNRSGRLKAEAVVVGHTLWDNGSKLLNSQHATFLPLRLPEDLGIRESHEYTAGIHKARTEGHKQACHNTA